MNKKILLGLFALLLFPASAFAHEERTYTINGVAYEFVVGSLGEPVIVDDKTGVDFELTRNGKPVIGVQDSLQVELISGDVTKKVSLSPVWGAEGKYKSNFIATVPTTLTYRFFGTLENAPVDLTFTCNPAGNPAASEVTAPTKISDSVIQTSKKGAFGCPQPKEDFGFPEKAPNVYEMGKEVTSLQQNNEVKEVKSKLTALVLVAILLSILSLCVGIVPLVRKKK